MYHWGKEASSKEEAHESGSVHTEILTLLAERVAPNFLNSKSCVRRTGSTATTECVCVCFPPGCLPQKDEQQHRSASSIIEKDRMSGPEDDSSASEDAFAVTGERSTGGATESSCADGEGGAKGRGKILKLALDIEKEENTKMLVL